MNIHITKNREKFYYVKNYIHNEYGPAHFNIFRYKMYIINDKLHNELGPAAIIYSNGLKRYYLNDHEYSYNEWLKRINRKV